MAAEEISETHSRENLLIVKSEMEKVCLPSCY